MYTVRVLYLPINLLSGNMSGDREAAHWNPQDFTLLMLQACVKVGAAPDVAWGMEMTPVDFAAQFIVSMTKNASLCIGKTFHIVNDKPLQSKYVNYTVDVILFYFEPL